MPVCTIHPDFTELPHLDHTTLGHGLAEETLALAKEAAKLNFFPRTLTLG